MNVYKTSISDVLLLEPKVFGDDRGFFFESFNARDFARDTGLHIVFLQDNHSRSAKNVLRGLHYQLKHPQGRLLRVIAGEVFDVAVDLRRGSPTFAKYFATRLSAENKRMIWVPEGFAHGFLVTSDYAEVLYKTTDYWFPEHERCIAWNDPRLGIPWPVSVEPLLSAKDRRGGSLDETDVFP